MEDTIRRLLPTPAPPPLQAAPKYTDRDTLVRQLIETICPEDRRTPAIPSEMESVDDTIRRLLPTPAPPPLQAAPKYTDKDILVQQLRETICPPMLVAQERPPMNDLETPSFNRFPVKTVTEEDSTEGCFSCGEWTHNTEQCQALDESFPFLPIGWVAERNENTFSLGSGPPSSPRSDQMENKRLVRGEGLVDRISNVYRPQLPMITMDIPHPVVPCYSGTVRLDESADT